MSYRRKLNLSVFDAALRRLIEIYQTNARIIVAFSGGKDSGVCFELARLAAYYVGKKVEVFMLDDEIMFPGTFEYADYVASQKNVVFHWMIAQEPMPAVWNRNSPYWWVFDWELEPNQWVRKPPSDAVFMPTLDLYEMVNPTSFPPPPGEQLIIIIGNRVEESKARLMSIHATASFLTKPTKLGAIKCYPIYDWSVKDIWRSVHENKWVYNTAYDVMFKMGMSPKKMRIAPPTMTWYGMDSLRLAAKAWPKWFDKVEQRVPGAKVIANYGLRAVIPIRKPGETWKECYQRTCIDEAPYWIKERAFRARERMLSAHSEHSTNPFPEVDNCTICGTTETGSWKSLATVMYTGDPYSLKATFLPYVQPSSFRPEDKREWKFNPAAFK